MPTNHTLEFLHGVFSNHIDVEVESIEGLEAIKQAFYELVILPLQRPEFSHGNASWSSERGSLKWTPPPKAPRPFSETDLMKALVTSRRTGVVANEYSRLIWTVEAEGAR
ncbi:hypothetical protein V6N13_108688 [Hibiscus sabdariffa]|uniref:Uncharacterized protein n=1 Tax=Hibiscus sabdariffa TaxID=183260 RepID=A0ABR2ST99_9ROSI